MLYTVGRGISTAYKVVDSVCIDAILYILIRHIRHSMYKIIRLISRLSILSLVSISIIGCSSMTVKTGSQDGFIDAFIQGAGSDPRLRPWDPPIGVGYGARIPNMEGDWERFCGGEKQVRNGCMK